MGTLINWLLYIVIIFGIYLGVKKVIDYFKGETQFVSDAIHRTTETRRQKEESAANLPLLIDDIVNSILSYCGNMNVVTSISVYFSSASLSVYLKNGKTLNYNYHDHGYDVSDYAGIAKALSSRLNLTLRPVWEDNVADQGKHISGYVLLSDEVVKQEAQQAQEIQHRRHV